MTGRNITEEDPTFHFDAGVLADQYDKWQFFDRGFQSTCAGARELRVVLHLEQPEHWVKSHRGLNPSTLKQGLKQRLRFIDAQSRVEDMHKVHSGHPWRVTSP